jgi:type IV pilus assembly protein PilM
MSFLSTAETAFGLDISDQTLRLIQLAKTGKRTKIKFYNEIGLPAGCLINGEIKQLPIFSATLNKLLKTKRGRGPLSRRAIIALPETETFLKTLSIPAKADLNLEEKIKEILPQNLPLDLEEIYWDWQVAPKTNSDYHVLVGASPKRIVDDYLRVFTEVGLIPVVLEIEAAAIANLLIEHNRDTESQIIIDIGRNRTGLFLYDGLAQFTVSLPISGEQINDTIAAALDLNPTQAEEAKIVCGLDEKKCQGAILELLIPTVEELGRQILNAINFYYENFPMPREIKKLTLCGGGANTINLANVLAKATEIPTVMSTPFKSIVNPDPKFFTPEKSQSFITAIGLGLRGLSPETFYDHS